jgi:hypothetical protein
MHSIVMYSHDRMNRWKIPERELHDSPVRIKLFNASLMLSKRNGFVTSWSKINSGSNRRHFRCGFFGVSRLFVRDTTYKEREKSFFMIVHTIIKKESMLEICNLFFHDNNQL